MEICSNWVFICICDGWLYCYGHKGWVFWGVAVSAAVLWIQIDFSWDAVLAVTPFYCLETEWQSGTLSIRLITYHTCDTFWEMWSSVKINTWICIPGNSNVFHFWQICRPTAVLAFLMHNWSHHRQNSVKWLLPKFTLPTYILSLHFLPISTDTSCKFLVIIKYILKQYYSCSQSLIFVYSV